jgi:opacity protein-like surface antigen
MTLRLYDSAALRRTAAAVMIGASIGGARAADMPDNSWLRGSFTADAPAYVRWDGLQLGAQIGASTMNADFGNAGSDQISYILRNTTVQDEFSPSSWTTLPNVNTNSSQYGFFVGYNWQWSELVLGIDAAYNKVSKLEADAEDSIGRQVTTSDSTVHQVFIESNASLKLVDYATARAKAGYAFGQFLPYGMLGVAVGRFNYVTSSTVTDVWTPSGGTATTYGPFTQTDSKNNAIAAGFLVGLGMDVAIMPNVFVRGEWEFVAFAPVNGIRSQLNTGRVGLGVRF